MTARHITIGLSSPSRHRTERPAPRRGWIIAVALMALGSGSCVERVQAARQTVSGEAQLTVAATSFVVRFAPDHPLGRAQTLEALAVRPGAETAARSALEVLPELRGLCFERFTLGGDEIVLYVCESTLIDQTGDMRALWLTRLVEMNGVERADPNAMFVN